MTLDRPVFVTTIPKAGTYLMAAILRELGLRDLRRHVYPDAYHDYAKTYYKDGSRALPTEVHRPIESFAQDAGPGGFAVGHLHCGARERAALQGCHVIFLVRELREAIVSAMRFQAGTGRDTDAWTRCDDPAKMLMGYLQKYNTVLDRAANMVNWRWHASVTLEFRELRRVAVVGRLARWLDVAGPDPAGVVERARAEQTLTRLPAASTGFWSDAAERVFIERGGPDLNEALGYFDDLAARSIARAVPQCI